MSVWILTSQRAEFHKPDQTEMNSSVRYRSWFFKMAEENVLCDFSIVGTNRPQSVKNLVSRKTNLIYNFINYF